MRRTSEMNFVRVPVCCAKANSHELSRVWPVVAVADRSVIFIMSFGLDLKVPRPGSLMKRFPPLPSVLCRIIFLLLATAGGLVAADAAPLSYNFEVRPLQASKCFACHGMDAAKRKGKLRLDVREAALEREAFVPGAPDESELIKRLLTTDGDEVMPPPDRHSALSPEEIALLKRWVAEGAHYEAHWAFATPVKPSVPEIAGVSHPMDALVRATLNKKGWKPAPEAERTDWLRRVTFAITGLPPASDEIKDFLADSSVNAHEAVVDRLLKSPRYGERMAAVWCDAARYADTYGRHEDADSFVWPWRDWVIRAFNDNLPYDKFLQWQLAGDMLPDATQDQRIATAFNRLPVQSNESGSDPEEFRWDQVFDRVKTTATTVLGLSMDCARCHDHKFDPLTRSDYYKFAAFFDKIDELGLFSRYSNGIPSPSAFVYKTGEQEHHAKLKADLLQAGKAWQEAHDGARARFDAWLADHAPPSRGKGLWGELATPSDRGRIEAILQRPHLYMSFDLIDPRKNSYLADNSYDTEGVGTASTKETAAGKLGRALVFHADKPRKFGLPPRIASYLRWQPFTFSFWLQMDEVPEHAVILHRSRAGLDAANRGYELTFEDGRLTATLAYFYPGNAIRVQSEERLEFKNFRHVAMTYDGSSKAGGIGLFADGRRLRTRIVRDHLTNEIAYLKAWGDQDSGQVADSSQNNAVSLKIGGRTLDSGIKEGAVDEFRVYNDNLSAVEVALLAGVPVEADDTSWKEWFIREIDEPSKQAYHKLRAARHAEAAFATQLGEMMVMDESHGPKRHTVMLNRGDFRQPGDAVEPSTPATLLPFPEGAPRDRRGLAAWIIDPQHPLTSRVQVNRLWTMFFGQGLVITAEDFGMQGKVPVYPEILDLLSVEFMDSGWDLKALCKSIALSSTYRQSTSPADPGLYQSDPDNAFLARGPRFRLPAEQLRDAALAASGLLTPTIGGPSVKPYQPAGLWEESGTQHSYVQDKGELLHRRSLYTFWRRTCPPPVMSVFDAPTREFCVARRASTLTPLQALALMNDMGFVEAGRVLAEKLNRQFPAATQDIERVNQAFLALIGRPPSPVETKAMTSLLQESRDYYQTSPKDATTLIAASGETPSDASLPAVEVAATTLMVRALLNSESFMVSY